VAVLPDLLESPITCAKRLNDFREKSSSLVPMLSNFSSVNTRRSISIFSLFNNDPPWPVVRKRTKLTERPPLVDEVSITVLHILIDLRFYQSSYIRNFNGLKSAKEHSPYFSYTTTPHLSTIQEM
jgi:hypothetical protein